MLRRAMLQNVILIAVAALLAIPVAARAQQPAANTDQPYSVQLGDKQVTSVKRRVLRGPEGVGLSRKQLLDVARQAVPMKVTGPDMDVGNFPR